MYNHVSKANGLSFFLFLISDLVWIIFLLTLNFEKPYSSQLHGLSCSKPKSVPILGLYGDKAFTALINPVRKLRRIVSSFCEQKVGKPRTNCNRRYSNCFRLRKLSLKTYRKSQKVPLICIVEATERNHGPGPWEPKMPLRNGVKFCNVSMLQSFGTFNKVYI